MLTVIGAGLGRTGTYTLKLALEALGRGPCHHMEEVAKNAAQQVPLWAEAARGRPDFTAIYRGYGSAVDWPTAAFWQELAGHYPEAKIVLTRRSAESWAASFSETIAALLARADEAPAQVRPWFEMCLAVTRKNGFRGGMSQAALEAAFEAHNDAVRQAIPADRLLVYEVRSGWAPLCAFLGAAVPPESFPVSNNRKEFWDLAKLVLG